MDHRTFGSASVSQRHTTKSTYQCHATLVNKLITAREHDKEP